MAVDRFVKSELQGIKPIYAGQTVYIYNSCMWQAVHKDILRSTLIDFHNKKLGISDANKIIEALKVLYVAEEFPDANTQAITLENGTLNLTSGLLEVHKSENYHRNGMQFKYRKTAKCTRWMQYLNEVFDNDPDKQEKIDFMQEMFGYLLTPSTKFHVMFWLYGGGSNGKGIITKMIHLLLGKNNVSNVQIADLSKQFYIADTVGKLANVCDELSSDALLSDDVIKQMVSGDRMTGEKKGKDIFSFTPTARIVVSTNHLPKPRDSSHGFFRRILILSFNNKFENDNSDRVLVDKLIKELPGIFVWAVAGLERLEANQAFTRVPSVAESVQEYKTEANSVAMFHKEVLMQTDDVPLTAKEKAPAKIKAIEVYKTYREYCTANGHRLPVSNPVFGKSMTTLGVKSKKSSGIRYYLVKFVNLEAAGINTLNAPIPERYPTLESAFEE